MPFHVTANVSVQRDTHGRIGQLTHLAAPYRGEDHDRRDAPSLAAAYLRDVADLYKIDKQWLEAIDIRPAERPESAGTQLRGGEVKHMLESVTIAYAQTHRGVPVWQAGVSVSMQDKPLRVTSSASTLHEKVDVKNADDSSPFSPKRMSETLLAQALKLNQTNQRILKINSRRWRIYRYAAAERIHRAIERLKDKARGKSAPPPSLPLPKLTDVAEGQHVLVTEVLFTLPMPGWGNLNWRAFLDANTGAVLYLRALAACADGLVFIRDPASRSSDPAVVATATNAVLNPWRQTVTLPGLTPPAPGSQQALTGEFVQVSDIELPAVAPPTEPVGTAFDFNARAADYAAVNAYYHVDSIFRLVQSMGFTIQGAGAYFDGTTFPIPVDHQGYNGEVNAHCLGDTEGDGVGSFGFGPCAPGTAVGMCTEFQTVAHEFGHALLYDSVHSANFGFCHSAGDSLAVILNDPYTLRTGAARFQTFPWCPIGGLGERFHNRDVGGGWAWGGTMDDADYGSEQILSTALFRIYQVTGGDSTHWDPPTQLATKEQAARYMAYLIFRSIGSLATDPVTTTPDAGVYATALMNADIGTLDLDTYPGGTHNKLLRWSFEKQGLYQPPGAATPVATAGAPPDVDVYIDDGRAGEYSPFLEAFWETTDIWNLTTANPATTPADHTTPLLGVTNFCYVRVRNRGTQTANNVVVRGYHNRPSAGLLWPGDWLPMTTDQLPAAGSPALNIPPGGVVTVGPFEWTPQIEDHECLLMWVSADGDLANADPATGFPCAAGPTPHWRLVPFDNNIAQRNVAPVPGAGGSGSKSLSAAMDNRSFWVSNGHDREARIRVDIILPAFLRRLGWKGELEGVAQGGALLLKGRESRRVRIRLAAGKDFTPTDLKNAKKDVRIRVTTVEAGILTGGISFELDPRMKVPAATRPKGSPKGGIA
jgi:hypothetical protein